MATGLQVHVVVAIPIVIHMAYRLFVGLREVWDIHALVRACPDKLFFALDVLWVVDSSGSDALATVGDVINIANGTYHPGLVFWKGEV